MLQQSSGEKYPKAMRILHWLIAALILGLLTAGLIMTNLPKGDPLHNTLYSLHKSFGVTVLFLAVLRVIVRLKSAVPPLPAIIPPIERALAQAGHWTLYCFMFIMPVSGYVMSTSYGLPVRWFGVTLPRLMGVDKARGALAANVHYYAAYMLMALIAGHAGAVIVHYYRQRVNLLNRML